MIQTKIVQGSLLYHAAHGLCSVKKMTRESEAMFYSLEPKSANKMKMRFIIPADGMTSSGFHSLMSASEANAILNYLQKGELSQLAEGTDHEASSVAKQILSFCHDRKEVRDQRSRQRMKFLVHGLVEELSIVLKMTLKEMAEIIRRRLGHVPNINPLVISALEHAGEDS